MGGVNSVKAASKYIKLGSVLTLDQAVSASTSGTGVAIVNNDSKIFTNPNGDGTSMVDVSDATGGYMFKLTAKALVDEVQYYRITCFNPNSTLVAAGDACGIYGGNILSPVSWGAIWASTIKSEEWDGREDFQYGAQWCFESDGSGGYYIKSRAVGSENPYVSSTGTMTNGAGKASFKFYSLVARDKVTLSFNSSGVANIDLTKLDVSGSGLSYNSSTGEVTSTGTSGTIFLSFDNADFTNVNTITVNVTTSGDYTDICNTSQVIDAVNGSLNTWYGSRYGMNLAEAEKGYQAKAGQITTIKWNVNATGTMKINSITITGNVINGSAPGWVDLTKSMYTDPSTCELNLNKDEGTVVYGKMWGFTLSDYADITNYPQMKITGTAGTTIRIFINSTSAENYTLDSEGSLVIDFANDVHYKDASTLHLCNIRPVSGGTANISSIQLYNPNYVLNGSGYILSSAKDILDNTNMTSIDAMGITAATALTTANSNCLITANSGKVTNSNNVIVDGVCTSLELSDGNYPFKAPEEFTAESVSYNRTFTVGKASTVCLPFELSKDEAHTAGTFYTLTAYEGGTLTFTEIGENDGTEAYKPYLFKAASGTPFSSAYANKEIAETPATLTGTTVEGYTLTGVLTGSTDVAADHAGKTVYGWSANSGEEEGKFVQVGSGVSIDPFRAYVVYNGSGNNARLAARFVGGSVTGINEVSEAQGFMNFEGKVFENGKIVIYKKGMKFNANGARLK